MADSHTNKEDDAPTAATADSHTDKDDAPTATDLEKRKKLERSARRMDRILNEETDDRHVPIEIREEEARLRSTTLEKSGHLIREKERDALLVGKGSKKRKQKY